MRGEVMNASTRVALLASYLAPLAWAMGVLLFAMAIPWSPVGVREFGRQWAGPVLLAAWGTHMVVVGHAFLSARFPSNERRAFLRRTYLGSSPYAYWRAHVNYSAPERSRQ